MIEKMMVGALLLFYFFVGYGMIRQEIKNQEQAQRDAVILREIADLKKQARINAQDVDFLERLVLEGKQ